MPTYPEIYVLGGSNNLWNRRGKAGLTPSTAPGTVFVDDVTFPDASNMGAGTGGYVYPTTTYNGDYTLTAGNTLSNTIVTGQLIISGMNTHVVNCVIQGGAVASAVKDMITVTATGSGTVPLIEFTTVQPSNPSLWTNSLGRKNFKAYRCHFLQTVDGVDLNPATSSAPALNAEISNCWIERLSYYAPDPNHGTAPSETHNDCIQIFAGDGAWIHGNRLDSYHDQSIGTQPEQFRNLSAVMLNVSGTLGPTTNVLIENNWIEGGAIAINGVSLNSASSVTIRNNRFKQDQANYPIVVSSTTTYTVTGNTDITTGALLSPQVRTV